MSPEQDQRTFGTKRTGGAQAGGKGERIRWKRPVLIVLLAFAAIVGLSSCSGIPETVITVPGSYTFGRGTSGIAGGTAVLCLDEHTAMQVTASWTRVSGNLVWDGTNYPITIAAPSDTSWTSPPLGPGCGTIYAATFLTSVPDTLTITVEKAPSGA
ncbi:MAG: hypothetical protein ACK4V6_07505 [Microthrixaceae bacterium]